jgi:hypothetical protein
MRRQFTREPYGLVVRIDDDLDNDHRTGHVARHEPQCRP